MIIDLSSIIPAISFLLYVVFAVFGIYHKGKEKIHLPFILYMGVMVIWSFGSFLMHADTGILSPLFWNRFMMVGMLGVPMTIFHSIVHLAKLEQKLYRYLIYLGYAIYGFLLVLNFSGSIVTDAWFEEKVFSYRLAPGAFIAYSLSYAYLLFCVFLLIRELIKTGSSSMRQKLSPVLAGAVIMLGGVLVNLHEPLGRYPIDLFAATVNAVLIFISIYKYRLVHYSMIVLRIIMYLVLVVISSFVFYAIIWAAFRLLAKAQFEYTFLVSLILGIVASIIFQPLRRGTLTVVEKLYLGKRLSYLNSLRAFSARLLSITDLQQLCAITVEKMVSTCTVKWAFIAVLDYTSRNYRMVSEKGLNLSEYGKELLIEHSHPFISALIQKRGIYVGHNGSSHLRVEVGGQFLELRPSLGIPLIFKERVNGFILLGNIQDRDYYNQYELESLELFAGQCSVSLENAISFERLRRQQKRLHHLNEELIISRNKLEAFFDGITNPISIQDINYNIITVNFAASKYFNLPYDDIVGDKCYRVFFNRDKPCTHCMAQDCLHTSLPFSTEITDGRSGIVFSIQFYPVQMPAGADKLILEFFQDITQQKRLQEELIKSEKLAGIGTLASGIAHEINNPLSGILGTAEILLEDIGDKPELREYVTDIISYSETAAEIIKELTSYARPKRAHKESVNIIQVLEDSLALARRGLSFDNIRINKMYENLPPVDAHKNELQQIFLNIIINSAQAMDLSGTLTMTCHDRRGTAYISIEDTGSGIPEKDLDNIFNPFFTTKEPGQGTGLGLSITHQLVQGMGGRINVKSTPGMGTVFEVYIPLNEQERNRIRFVIADTRQMKDDVFYIQRKILVGEKGYTEETIHREVDDNAVHFLAFKGLQPVGTVSCLTEDEVHRFPIESHFSLGEYKQNKSCFEINRLAVLPEVRGSIISLGLMTLAYLYGKSKIADRIFLDVFSDESKQVAMYQKLGFKVIGHYSSPLPVTVMMLDRVTDYEKAESRMEHFVKPFFNRLKIYMDFNESDKQEFIAAIEKLTMPPVNTDSHSQTGDTN